MLEYLGYAFFAFVMVGCLTYVMSALETEAAADTRNPAAKEQQAQPAGARLHHSDRAGVPGGRNQRNHL